MVSVQFMSISAVTKSIDGGALDACPILERAPRMHCIGHDVVVYSDHSAIMAVDLLDPLARWWLKVFGSSAWTIKHPNRIKQGQH